MQAWRLSAQNALSLDAPRIMGILNVTPDSFADGGKHGDVDLACDAAAAMVLAGADVLDIGGESTRPGASPVDEDEQVRRVVPVIARLRREQGPAARVPISVDTTRARVAEAALDAGADAINDQSAGLDDPAMLRLCARRGAGIVLMHRRSLPARDAYSDQYAPGDRPAYADVVHTVAAFLHERSTAAQEAGIAPEAIVVDPGLGFGKTVEQNLQLITRTDLLISLGFPVLSALSRKSFVGRVSLQRDSLPSERLAGTLACSLQHLAAGARLFRVHDVPEHREALAAAWACMAVRGPASPTPRCI